MITNNNSDNRKKTANNKQVKHNAIAHHLLTEARPPSLNPNKPLLGNSPSLYTEHVVLWCGISPWPVWVTCPSGVPSQIFFFFFLVYQWQSMKHIKKKEFLT